MNSAATKAATVVESRAARLLSLDVLRGLAVAGMILVTVSGTYSAVYPQLLHAAWNGATATDMIFPAFLFAVGIAIVLSFSSRMERGCSRRELARHVLLRSVIIFVLGLAVNGFPDYNPGTLRIPGILQRIALCYLSAAMLYLVMGTVAIAATVVVVLAGYWAALTLVPVPGFGPGHLDSFGSLPAWMDRAVFGTRHMWIWGTTPGHGVTYDPEGLLSTMPAIATVLIGIVAGEWLRSGRTQQRKALGLAGAGALFVVAGLLLSGWLPINKRLWTSTFVLFSSGVTLLVMAALYAVLEIRHWTRWALPFRIFGANAVLAFALSSILTTMTDRIYIGGVTLHRWAYQQLFLPWLQPVHASLAYALAVVLLNMALLWPLYRKRIYVRV